MRLVRFTTHLLRSVRPQGRRLTFCGEAGKVTVMASEASCVACLRAALEDGDAALGRAMRFGKIWKQLAKRYFAGPGPRFDFDTLTEPVLGTVLGAMFHATGRHELGNAVIAGAMSAKAREIFSDVPDGTSALGSAKVREQLKAIKAAKRDRSR